MQPKGHYLHAAAVGLMLSLALAAMPEPAEARGGVHADKHGYQIKSRKKKPALQDGPDQTRLPVVDCVTGLYDTEHRVYEGSNGRYAVYDIGGSHRFDASDILLDGINSHGDFVPWPVKINSRNPDDFDTSTASPADAGGGCWYGGHIEGAWDEYGEGVTRPDDGQTVTWESPYHHAGAMTIEMDDFLVEDVSVHGHGDGLRPRGDRIVIDGAYLHDIHDDCIENDNLNDLRVTDSLLDGCYVAFSARSYTGSERNGRGKLIEISHSLVRLEPQPTVYKPYKYGIGPGHGQFFKWQSDPATAPALSLHNTMFIATQPARHGSLGLDEISHLESCSNNVMVWAGEGSFPDADKLPDCFRISRDVSEWDRAVAQWHTRHPNRVRH